MTSLFEPAIITPRDYQQEAIDKTVASWDTSPGALMRFFTGGGKTIVASLLIDKWLRRGDEYRAIVLCHERQLAWQFADEVEDVLGIRPDIEMGDMRGTGTSPITIASRASLYIKHRDDGARLSRLYKYLQKFKWLVVCDEAHRYARKLPSVGPIIEWFERDPDNRRLGLTATPERADGTSLESLFPTVVSDYRLYAKGEPCAVDDGWAVEYEQRFVRVDNVDFKNIETVAGDFSDDELERLLGDKEQLSRLVDPTMDIVGDRSTLIFSPTVAMAKRVALHINAELGCEAARSLDGSVPEPERKAAYRGHQRGDFQFLSVCGLCLGSGTLILTDKGEIPIQNVTTDMKLWDGVEYVTHDGVIFKGNRPVIEYAGLTATGDHDVWTDAGWRSLADCKKDGTPVRVSGVGGKAVRETSGHYRSGDKNWQSATGRLRDTLHRMWSRVRQAIDGLKARRLRLSEMLQREIGRAALAVDEMCLCKEPLHQSGQPWIQPIRNEGDQVSVQITAGHGAIHGDTPRVLHGNATGSDRQRRPLREGQPAVGHSKGKCEQQALEEPIWIEPTRVAVYDILNAGPRNRFTANGLTTKNCREGYNDPGIAAVAIFRPTKSKGLAEQMKGRGCRPLRGLVEGLSEAADRKAVIASSDKPTCIVVDLVGATGLADCASTAQIFAHGLPDEVVDLANEILIDGETDVRDALDQAERELEAERKLQERLAAERHKVQELLDAELRARLDITVDYNMVRVVPGAGGGFILQDRKGRELATKKQQGFLRWKRVKFNDHKLTKAQAGRLIGMLKRGIPASAVQRQVSHKVVD